MRKCMYTKKIFRFLRPVCNFFLEILSQCGNVRPWTSHLFHPLHTHIHRWSIQSTLWMLMHGNEPADQQFLYQARGRQIQKLLSFFYTEDKMSVGEMEVIKVLLVLSFTLSSGNARKVTFHAFIMQHYTDAEIRLTVPLAKMIATVRVIPNPEI